MFFPVLPLLEWSIRPNADTQRPMILSELTVFKRVYFGLKTVRVYKVTHFWFVCSAPHSFGNLYANV